MAKSIPTSAFRFRRSSEMNVNPTSFISRSNAFAAAFAKKTHGTLLVKRSEQGLEGFLLVPDGNDRAAHDLSSIIGAEFERVIVPELETDSVGHLVMQKGGASARETQAGIDPSELSRQLVNILSQHGSWVAVTFRRTSTTELKRQRSWIENRMGTAMAQHHTSGTSPLVVSITAGSGDDNTTRIILSQVAAALPGFDIAADAKMPTPLKEAAPYFGGAVAALLIPVLARFGLGTFLLWHFFTLVALVSGGYGVAKFLGLVSNSWKALNSANLYTDFAHPAKWKGLRYRRPRKEVTIPGKEKKGYEGDYPFSRSAFLVGASVITGLVAPQSGALSGEQTSKQSNVPPPLLERVGPYIGETKDGSAYLSADDFKYGVAVVGRAGSGKTLLLRSLFAWSMLDKIKPSGMKGFAGTHNALISFESKGDGVAEYREWSKATTDPLIVIDFSRPDSYAIDMFDVPGSFKHRANFFVNSMVYAFKAGAIEDRSFMTLTQIFAAALTVDKTVLASVANIDLDPDGDVMYYAVVMLGGFGDKASVALMSAIITRAVALDREKAKIVDALSKGLFRDVSGQQDVAKIKQAERYVKYVSEFTEAAYNLRSLAERTEAQRRSFTEAPISKVTQLLDSAGKSWWSKSRKKIGWGDLLTNHRSVIINTGTSELGELVPERLGAQLSSMLLYSLKDAIMRNCSGWEKQNRWVSIFSDELSLLAGNSPEVLTWLRDQGRSSGVRPFLATQRPAQLPEQVRKVFLNFATLISFSQDEPSTAEEIAVNVATNEDWTKEEILHLAPYTAVIRAGYQFKRQTAFSVKVGNFEDNRSGFAATQGYGGYEEIVPLEQESTSPEATINSGLVVRPVKPQGHRSSSTYIDDEPVSNQARVQPYFVNPATGDSEDSGEYPTLGESALGS